MTNEPESFGASMDRLFAEFDRIKAALGVKDGEELSFTAQFDEAASVWRILMQLRKAG